MKDKRQFAFNRLFNLFIIVGILCGSGAIAALLEQEWSLSIGLGIFALFFFVAALLATPYCYRFDSEGVTICYAFFQNERYLWVNIHTITVTDDDGDSHNIFFDWLFSRVFALKGKVEGERRTYMRGHIQKSGRTKRLLEKYWDGTIIGYWGEKSKSRKGKVHRAKPRQTEEIIPMEREAEANAKEWLKPFSARAAQMNLTLRTKFRYITKDLEELKSRPDEEYTYTAIVEIAPPGETKQNRIVEISVDLLYVRIGKNAYRGVANENALTELQGYLTDMLDEIQKSGHFKHRLGG